ncbi:MAG: acetate/propionate family kinase [Chthoniobacterales bacterium]|nr:acetate/propionate family kinase [Chthoniobacterales bacterium]
MSIRVLCINVGSSSIKFALYQHAELLFHGKIQNLNQESASFFFQKKGEKPHIVDTISVTNYETAASFFLDWLESQKVLCSETIIGHRIVHGMSHRTPQRIDTSLLQELHALKPYAPDHLPQELKLIEAFLHQSPHLDQYACFDTSFHQTMPQVAKLLPLPRHYLNKGLERYGFHGLSYEYLMEELSQKKGSQGRVILAHLGNGASLAAVHHGKSIDTSMGFTPTSGLVMGSRSGDLDPGIARYLEQTEQMTTDAFFKMVNKQSGLLGISETSSNMSELLALEKKDIRAAQAVEFFCYQTKKWIGAYTAALGGLDTLVFSGGIGENAPVIRERICRGLEFLGLHLNKEANQTTGSLVSSQDSRIAVHMIPTNEELMIARSVYRIFHL